MPDEQNIEEQLPGKTESTENNENISAEENNVPQPQTINPQNEEMEVHHSHHPAHKKKWTEYFLEFFMLFLAVFLGFIAENIREESVEHNRAKEYTMSLYRDIIQDTINLTEAIRVSKEIAFKIDTLRDICRGKAIKDVKAGAIYYYSRFTFRHWGFNSNDATIQQLKNSGSLRYFKNYELEDAIGRYDQSVRWLDAAFGSDRDNLRIATEYRFQLLDAYVLDSVMSYTLPRNFINEFMQHDEPLVVYDKVKWEEYLNCAAARSAGLKRLIDVAYIPVLKNGRKVISLLKKEYHLENEKKK